ncbi:MAG TPA: hypothetical protein VGI45_19880 [Terracidiphilus sp.]
MKILRDESGYVLVLGRPQFAGVGEIAEKDQELQPSAKALAEPQKASCALPHCCFYCSWCGEPILLPHDRIGTPFGNPDARKIDVRSVATVCHKCRHIGNYTMFRGCRGFDTRHKIVHALGNGTTTLLNWLQCDEKTCTARVPLFVRLEQDPVEGDTEVTEWLWDELTCAYGHRIKPIPLDPTLHLPFRTR